MDVLEQQALVNISKITSTIDWEQRRYEIARNIFPDVFFDYLNTNDEIIKHGAQYAVKTADALIVELKKELKKEEKNKKEIQKKYRFTEETMEIRGHIIHRIKAVKDFGYIKKGSLGGWIEKEENLSHDDNCWVDNNAKIFGNAKVSENARIFGDALVYGNAKISGNAIVGDNAKISGNAKLFDNAVVYYNAVVYGNSIVCGNTVVGIGEIVYNCK